MNLILKYTLRNTKSNKFRTFIIVLAIAVASSLIFVSTAITNTTLNIFEQQSRKYCGDADIKVSVDLEKEKNMYFTPIVIDNMENSAGFLQENAMYEESSSNDVNAVIVGAEIDELNEINKITMDEGKAQVTSNNVIIGKKLADEYNIKLNDYMKVSIYGQEDSFHVTGIAKDSGLFRDDGSTNVILMSKDTAGKFVGQEDSVNVQYIKLKNNSNLENIIDDLSEEYDTYTIEEAVSRESSEQTTKLVTLVFTLVTLIVIVLAAYIISSTFKTIILERMPVIGTFRSIGATKRFTCFIMLTESLLYGVIGSFIGTALGIGMLNIIADVIKESWGGTNDNAVEYGMLNILTAFILGAVIAVISSLFNIIKTRKVSIKDLVFNKNEDKVKNYSTVKLVVLLVVLAATQILPYVVKGLLAQMIDGISIAALIALIPLLIPYITKLFSWILSAIGRNSSSSVMDIACKNLKDDKNVRSNITMVAIGIACLLMISTVGKDVISQVIDTFSSSNYQITLSVMNQDDNTTQKIKDTKGVEDFIGLYEKNNVKVDDATISYLDGINPDSYKDYFNMTYLDEDADAVQKLKGGKNIILNRTFKNSLGIDVGDTVSIETGKDKTVEYTVAAFMDTMWVGGSYGMISDENMKKDFDCKQYDTYWIITNETPEKVINNLEGTFSNNTITASTTEEIRNNIVNANSIMFVVVDAFSVIAIIIGIIGVFNNILLSFMKRKRTLVLYRSIGMSRKQTTQMIFIESISAGLFGGIVGVGFGALIIRATALLLKEVMATVYMTYSIKNFVIYIMVAIIIMIVTVLSPLRKTLKLNIIETLKFE